MVDILDLMLHGRRRIMAYYMIVCVYTAVFGFDYCERIARNHNPSAWPESLDAIQLAGA